MVSGVHGRKRCSLTCAIQVSQDEIEIAPSPERDAVVDVLLEDLSAEWAVRRVDLRDQ